MMLIQVADRLYRRGSSQAAPERPAADAPGPLASSATPAPSETNGGRSLLGTSSPAAPKIRRSLFRR